MRAKLRDTELFFDVEGLGWVPDGPTLREKPVTVLLHGGPGADHTGYKPTFSSLADVTQLIYLDHRGQGRSARGNPTDYTLNNNVEDLEALRQYLGLGPIMVIGGSYGGMVALAYASRYPRQVRKLMVYATAASHHFLPVAQETLRRIGTAEQRAIAQHLWGGSFRDDEHLGEYFRQLGPLYALKYDAAQAAIGSDRTILSYQATNQAFGGFLRSFDLIPELARITAPTLVLGAQQDWICAPRFSTAIAQAIPQAQCQIVQNCGHMIRTDQPAALMGHLRSFITA
ncbi:MAG: alpha/beta hydrolase [Alkalinema sp. RU_4_3]|nr:alpha/beta hydrolase [Alkalinema sp. RU_4_3]